MGARVKRSGKTPRSTWLLHTCRDAAWAPITVFIFYAIAARGFDAYLRYPWLDMPTHFFGGVAITYFFLAATRHAQPTLGAIPPLVQALLSLGLTALTAIAWEFLEFASDALLGTKMNLGVADTLADLLLGLVGGAVMVVLSRPKVQPLPREKQQENT